MATPILKWAGGKRQLMPIIDSDLPPQLTDGTISKYAEPFFGGGAVFFHLVEHYNIEKAYISDLNIELILMYRVVQKHVNNLISELQMLSDKYFSTDDMEKRKEFFYQVRTNFNKQKDNFDINNIDELSIKRVAEIIFLNKTCFNGLFRVNKSGEFNVPFAKPKNPKILNEENLKAVSKVLQIATIEHASYEDLPQEFKEDTFLYFDPPYRPLNQTSKFTAYSIYDFTDTHQEELANYFNKISHSHNTFAMLSNSDPKNTDENDNFFDTLYGNHTIKRISATRMINSKSNKRGKVSELLITNYRKED